MYQAICTAITIILAICAMSGCGSDQAQGQPDHQLVVGFSQIGAESDWRRANTASIKDAAKDHGVKLLFSDAQQKQENQIRAIRTFIAQRVDFIVVAPVVTTGWDPVLREAKAAGIPVVLTDRAIETSDPSLYVTLIGPDPLTEGRRAGEWLKEHMQGVADIAELCGTPGSAPAIERHKGFMSALAGSPGMRVIKSQSAEFTRAKGKEVMAAMLKSDGGDAITAVFAHNDDMAIGAIQAIEEAGKIPGKDVKIVSIDAVAAAIRLVQAGTLNCTVECNPIFGDELMQAIERLKRGEQVERWVKPSSSIFAGPQDDAVVRARKY